MKLTFLVVSSIVFLGMISSAIYKKEDTFKKEIVLNNLDSLKRMEYCEPWSDGSTGFSLDDKHWYYTHITVIHNPDSSYKIVLWGDRESFLWDILRDKKISVHIPYSRYENKLIETDMIIYKHLSDKK